MTDAFSPDDELISAYLDGEASPAEVSRVESSPELMARVEHLAMNASLVAEEVEPLPASVVDDLINGALAAGGGSESVGGNVTNLAEARRRRIPRSLLAAAAAVVAMALAVPALRAINLDSGSSSNSATAALDATADAGSGDSASNEKSFAQSATVTTAAAALESAAAPSTAAPSADSAAPAAGVAPDPLAASYDFESGFLGRLNGPDSVGFDPLPDQLPPVPDLATLASEITLAFSSAGNTPADTVGSRALTTEIAVTCDQLITDYLNVPHPNLDLSSPVLAADMATVEFNGTQRLVLVIRDAVDHAVALVVDLPDCSNLVPLEISP